MNALKFQSKFAEGMLKFVKRLFTRQTSAFLIIFGRRESGKTNLAFVLAEIVYYLGIIENIATNIRIIKSPFPIEKVTNLDDLRYWCKDKRGKKLYLFDEMGKAFRRRTPMAGLNIQIIDDLQILRKYKLSTIGITPNEKYVDSTALGSDILDGVFIKPQKFKDLKKNQKIALYYDELEGFKKDLYNIPRSSIEFDTWDVATFQQSSYKYPKFKEEDKEMLWKWCNGATAKSLDLTRTQIRRIAHKFIRVNLKKELQSNI